MERPDIVATRIVWMEPLEGTARDLLDAAGPQTERTSKVEDAEAFLKSIIQPGEKKLQTCVEAEANANGISKATLRRAKQAAKIKSAKLRETCWWERE